VIVQDTVMVVAQPGRRLRGCRRHDSLPSGTRYHCYGEMIDCQAGQLTNMAEDALMYKCLSMGLHP
jgi:hypothetical protein